MTDAVATGEHSEVDQGRRKFLTVATSATAAAGAVFALTPFIASWEPSERARALGAPVTVDLSKLEVGQMITYRLTVTNKGSGPRGPFEVVMVLERVVPDPY